MTFRKNLVVTLAIVLGIFTITTHARTWDLAIATGRGVTFFARNTTQVAQMNFTEPVTLSAMVYDKLTGSMIFSDVTDSANASIFSSHITENFTLKELRKKQKADYIRHLAFESESRTLFMADTRQNVIMKMHVSLNGELGEPKLLHNLTNQKLRDIGLDECNSHIYWVNSNSASPSIERSDLDGKNRMTVINVNLTEPVVIAIDHAEEKLYWIDDTEGLWSQIERSNLNGSERELLAYMKHQPAYLAVDSDSIYWSDMTQKAVRRLPKTSTLGVDSSIVFPSDHVRYDSSPAGIVALDNIGKANCAAAKKMKQTTTTTEEPSLITEASTYCLNNGLVNKDGTCQCKLGFTGTHCETNLCHNYCFHGSCSINSTRLPTCKCSGTFVGPRCEIDLCKDYCLHDGQCSVQDEKPVCKCKYFEGSRCEILSNTTELCEKFCANTEPVPTSIGIAHCRCVEEGRAAARMVKRKESTENRILLPLFGVFIALLVVVIVVLSYYVNKFRRRPRIRNRYVVQKGGMTPLTSPTQLPDGQCEITLENCCNMNICETPCFEPKLRAAAPDTNGTKKGEKNSLLDNMEDNSW